MATHFGVFPAKGVRQESPNPVTYPSISASAMTRSLKSRKLAERVAATWGCPLGWHKRLRHSSPFAVNLSTGRTTVQHSEFGRSSGGGLCGSATHQGITG